MTSAIWRCRTTQAFISWICWVKGKWRRKHVLACFFFFFCYYYYLFYFIFFLTRANFEWIIKELLDSAFVRCKESCRSPRRLLVDNTFLDPHYFSDSTQPSTRIALLLNLASIILITVLQSLKKSVIWINSDFLVTQENERGHWVPLEQYIGTTGHVAAQNYTINPAVQEPAVIDGS